MLATTRDSKNNVQSTISNINEWSPEDQLLITQHDDQLSSIQKHRSNSRHPPKKNRLPAPQVFRNCAFCGAFFINEEIVAVKPRQYCFRSEILPSQLICAFFEMQAEKRNVVMRTDIDQMCGQDIYLQGRKRIIDGVYKMGVKFRQARETIHIAIEMIDQYYLSSSQEMSAKAFKIKLMQAAPVILHQVTVLLIASKFDEIDDNITAIQDLREYVHKQVSHQQRRDYSLLPSFDQIVECERKILFFFNWDLKFVLPLHIVRAYLANGVLFSNEFVDLIAQKKSQGDIAKLKAEWSRSITTESLSISDLIVSKGNVTYRSESSSDIAASIVYLARKNILEADSPDGKSRVPNIWPQELVMITRCTEAKAKRILVDVLRPLEHTSGGERKEASQQNNKYQHQLQQQFQSADHHGKRSLLNSKQSAGEQNSSSLRNLQSDPKIMRNSAKVLESNNTALKSTDEQQQKAQPQKKENVALMKLSVLSQKHAQKSDLKIKQMSQAIASRDMMNSTAQVTDRAQIFIENYQSNQQLALEERRRAATIKQKIVKPKNELDSGGGGGAHLENQTTSEVTKKGSFAEIPKPSSQSSTSIQNIRQVQSQRQLFQSSQPQNNNNSMIQGAGGAGGGSRNNFKKSTGAISAQEKQKASSTRKVRRSEDAGVTDHMIDENHHRQDEKTGTTSQQEIGCGKQGGSAGIALTDEEDNGGAGSDTVEANYYNDMKRRSTQPCSKPTLPTIVPPTRSNVIQTCEKTKEAVSKSIGGGPMSDRTYASATILNEAGYLNPKPSVASVSSVLPTEISAQPFSSSRRPKNELGFQDETSVSKPTEDLQKTPFADVEEEAQESDEMDDSKEAPVARSSDMLPKPTKPQPTFSKNKKAQPQQQMLTKQKYLEIKRNQMAKKQQQRAAKQQQSLHYQYQQQHNHQFSMNSGDAALQSPSEATTTIIQYGNNNNTARNAGAGGSGAYQNDKSSANGYHLDGAGSLAPAAPAGPSTARDQLQSQQSNEYFSVRPKMMDHANQLALQQEQIRSSSIEYESHVTQNSDYSSILPTDFNKQNNRRWTVRTNTNSGQQVNQPSKVQVPLVSGSLVKQASESSNTTQNKLAASQVSFFKRENQRSMLSTNSAAKNKSIVIGDPNPEGLTAEHANENSTTSRGATEGVQYAYHSQSNMRADGQKTTAHKVNVQMLPNIDRKPSTATNQVVGHQALNFDFSSAAERFAAKPSTAKNSQQIVANGRNQDNPHHQQQVKYLTKTSGLHGFQRSNNNNKGGTACKEQKQSTITATQGLLRSQNHAQSMRHMQPSLQYEESSSNLQIMSSQHHSGINKTKSSIFGGNNNSSTATKSINGFGSTQPNPTSSSTVAANNHHHSTNNAHQLGSSKGFCSTQIRKGPSFNQMNYIATPTNMMETTVNNTHQQSKLLKDGTHHHERKISAGHTQQQQQVTGGPTSYNSFKQNSLIQAPAGGSSGQAGGHHHLHSQFPQAPHSQSLQGGASHHRTNSSSKNTNNNNSAANQAKHSQQMQQTSQPTASQSRFTQHSNTLKQVAADEAFASLRGHHQHTHHHHTHHHNQNTSSSGLYGVSSTASGDLVGGVGNPAPSRSHHFSKTASKEPGLNQVASAGTTSMPKVSSNPVLRNSLDVVSGGSTHLRQNHSNHKKHHHHHHHHQALTSQQSQANQSHHQHHHQHHLTASTSSQKKESSSSRIRQVPSSMMPNSQPIYGNKRNHATNLTIGSGGASGPAGMGHHVHHNHHVHHQHNVTTTKSNKLLTVEQNKTSSFLAGQQQQMVTSHTTKQLLPGRSYESVVKMLPRHQQQQNQAGIVATRGSGNSLTSHEGGALSQQNVLTISNGGNGYQNLRLRTLKQTNSQQQQQEIMKH